VLVVMVLALIASPFLRVNYASLSPGDATAVVPDLRGAHVYRSPGDVLFVTVSQRNRISVAEAIVGWLDPDVAVSPLGDVIGTHTPQQDLRAGILQMRQSKQAAAYVALHHLGLVSEVRSQGTLVADVTRGAPAAKVLDIGDVIEAIDGKKIADSAALHNVLAQHRPGDRITLTVQEFTPSTAVAARAGATHDVSVVLASYPALDGQPAQPHKAFLGIAPADNPMFTFPFHVELQTGEVGGPSAGLAFTLSLIDQLTPGGILHGHKIATTGTIDLQGNIGAVGGVAQKTVAVRRAGAQVFIVPRSEYRQAKAMAGSKLRVEPADNLDQALRIIQSLH
jgi:PDZ domain-containing protein